MQYEPARLGRECESGWGMVELIVVSLLVAILMAAIVPTFLNQKRSSPNSALVAGVQSFEVALAEYQRSFPPVGGASGDPLLTRGGSSAPFTETMPANQGLYSAAGDPLVKHWPKNPFTGAPMVVERAATCATTGAPGFVQTCRAPGVGGMPDLQQVRLVAFGKSPSNGSSVLAYDTITCGGPCKLK